MKKKNYSIKNDYEIKIFKNDYGYVLCSVDFFFTGSKRPFKIEQYSKILYIVLLYFLNFQRTTPHSIVVSMLPCYR